MAAIMCHNNHVKKDLFCLSVGKTLLANIEVFQKCDNQPEGTYSYYDTNNGIHARSGKVTSCFYDKQVEEYLG